MPAKRQRKNTATAEVVAAAAATPATVYLCFDSASEYRDHEVRVFAVTSTIEAARLACRDLAMQKRGVWYDEYDDERDDEEERKFWASSFESGSYDTRNCKPDSRYQYHIYIEGPKEIQTESDFPMHPFEEAGNEAFRLRIARNLNRASTLEGILKKRTGLDSDTDEYDEEMPEEDSTVDRTP